MTLLANIVCLSLALPACVACGYLLFQTLLSSTPKMPKPSSRRLRFDVVVPAHNETLGIERTVRSLLNVDWPKDKYRVLVVADNCTDNTAELARNAGATVIERTNDTQRGKGYALNYAFNASRQDGMSDAVVVVDADAEVSTNLLEAFASRIESGAHAVQAHYGVLNPMASWRTRLITIAKAAFHIVRSRARERLQVSCGIRGNGWCVTHELLKQVPYAAYSLTEDLEYGIELGLARYRVYYADEAHSDADMVTGEQIARKQRRRWEDGRFQLIRSRTWALLKAAVKQPSKICLDLAMDLLVLPLSYVALNVIALIMVSTIATWLFDAWFVWQWLGYGCAAGIVVYVLRGWQLSGIGIQGLFDLARAPGFLLWKVLLMFRRKEAGGWVRTDREGQ
jgi:1,2-diacylglycerol 3-beta-glucosyltransferase